MDIYNYWLMEKIAEEEKQESFAKRHKDKLMAGGALAGSGLAGYGAGRVASRESGILRGELDRAEKELRKKQMQSSPITKQEIRSQMEDYASGLRKLVANRKRLGRNTEGGEVGKLRATLKETGKRYREATEIEKNMPSFKKQRDAAATAVSDFDKRNVLGRAWQGGKRLVKDVGSKFLKRGK